MSGFKYAIIIILLMCGCNSDNHTNVDTHSIKELYTIGQYPCVDPLGQGIYSYNYIYGETRVEYPYLFEKGLPIDSAIILHYFPESYCLARINPTDMTSDYPIATETARYIKAFNTKLWSNYFERDSCCNEIEYPKVMIYTWSWGYDYKLSLVCCNIDNQDRVIYGVYDNVNIPCFNETISSKIDYGDTVVHYHDLKEYNMPIDSVITSYGMPNNSDIMPFYSDGHIDGNPFYQETIKYIKENNPELFQKLKDQTLSNKATHLAFTPIKIYYWHTDNDYILCLVTAYIDDIERVVHGLYATRGYFYGYWD